MSSGAQSIALRIKNAGAVRDYAELFKTRVTALVVVTAWSGVYFACAKAGESPFSWEALDAALGVGLVAAGTAGLNQVIERKLDAKMSRTCMRPLVTGSLGVLPASMISCLAILSGTILLGVCCNWLAALLALLTSAAYLGPYTLMKTVGPSCTLIGAFPGAMPPVLGWVAIRGGLDAGALVLFAILFLWQFPHFHSIGLLYRKDYERAGIRMLAVVDQSARKTSREILLCSLLLIPTSLLPTLLGMSGLVYGIGAALLGTVLLGYGARMFQVHARISSDKKIARQLLRATVLYLPALLGLMMFDRV